MQKLELLKQLDQQKSFNNNLIKQLEKEKILKQGIMNQFNKQLSTIDDRLGENDRKLTFSLRAIQDMRHLFLKLSSDSHSEENKKGFFTKLLGR